MSRAFLKDNDGWRYCWPKQTECLFVDDDGTCMCSHCRLRTSTKRADLMRKTRKGGRNEETADAGRWHNGGKSGAV